MNLDGVAGWEPHSSPYRTLALDVAEGRRDEAWLTRRLDFIDARLDLSDHRLLGILKLYLRGGDLLRPEQRARIEQTVLGFKYHWRERGNDSMCTWSETHQLLLAVCEYLAGQALPDRHFTNDGRTGVQKRELAERRLRGWLDDRFLYGFSEWLSNTYYEIDIIGLSVLIDHAEDPDLVTRATMVLDLLFYDIALHRFSGRFAASAGRAYSRQKARPSRAEINTILREVFETPQAFDPDDLSSVFIGRDVYQVPHAIRDVAAYTGEVEVRASYGLDVDEVEAEVHRREPHDPEARRDARLRLLWAMEAFTTPEGISATLEEFRRTGIGRNRFLAPLARFDKLRPALAPVAVRMLNPITQGAALHRANVLTFRTPHYQLSTAQRYQPGRFGDQQHIWQAMLPGDISVFATHPGSTTLGSESRPPTPSGWVGNGINPDVAQHRNVLLASYDTVHRSGYLEGFRHRFSHLHFPFSRFDETSLGERWLAGRRGDSFIGIVSLEPLELVTEAEVLQRGPVTAWAVAVTDRGEFGTLTHLVEALKRHPLQRRGPRLVWSTPTHRFDLVAGGEFLVDGVPESTSYPRYDTPWGRVPRRPTEITVTTPQHTLRLDWVDGLREVTGPDGV
ncbi:MAG TPA: hypothetical protein VHO26_13570 [Propionibacteriaceae bacterium]|nr:hypothetical protein [Propionibacteriaceae bacterium]